MASRLINFGRVYLWILLIVIYVPVCTGQNYPTDYFILPVEHAFRCSGSFGELRNNHFHMGVDIKSSKGISGDKILASADGYISRISINGGGYGNVLYIKHPNGYTSVYAHLSRFIPIIADYVRNYQYEHQTFESNIYPLPSDISVKQGDLIGYMGNSGRSFGPHLHFEIRESTTDTPINPMLFGIKPKDTRTPILTNLKVMEWDSSTNITKTSFYPVRKLGESYTLEVDTIYVSADSVRLALEMYDKMNGAANKNGIYRVKMNVDQDRSLDFIMHKISFEDSDYFNAHIDYYEWRNANKFFTNLYKLKRNPIPIYNLKVNQREGIKIQPGQSKFIQIEVSDIEQNKSVLAFGLKRDPKNNMAPPNFGNYILEPDTDQWIAMDKWIFHIDTLSVLESLRAEISAVSDTIWSHQNFKLGSENIHLFKPIEVYNSTLHADTSYWNKQCIIQCGPENINYGGEIKDSIFTTTIHNFGSFKTHIDTVPPTLVNVNLSDNMRGRSTIKFLVTEELKASSKKYKFTYNAWIDDQWVLLEYDEKNDSLIYRFDQSIETGEHTFKVQVSDWAGNTSKYTMTFNR